MVKYENGVLIEIKGVAACLYIHVCVWLLSASISGYFRHPNVRLLWRLSPQLWWGHNEGSRHLLHLPMGRGPGGGICTVPQGSITGDHLEGQWHLEGSSVDPHELSTVSVLMIVWYAGSCLG